MHAANVGCAGTYGADPWTQKARELLRDMFETDCETFFVFNGTAANALALSSICESHDGIYCHKWAHIETDECGAPGFFTGGAKLVLIDGEGGKISPEGLQAAIDYRSDIHYASPKALSLTQSTELGTVYTPAQVRDLSDIAHKHGVFVHMDGARFANAVASIGVPPAEIAWKAGVDVLSFGGTKNGLAVGEAVVFFNHDLAREFEYRMKQAGQLASKMRFLAAGWVGVLENGAWLKHATHANDRAAALESELRQIPGVRIMFAREANAVFVWMPESLSEGLFDRGWHFYTLMGQGDFRLMCSWATSDDDIHAFVGDLRELAARG
jgi:threonine aldolase